jgi:tetratricopeptide (TPR) repeat protein
VAAVTEICRRLDGLPLAIEFAAARVSHLPPQDIADRLKDMFRLLTGGRGRVQRQQTMQAALDWSYELLSESERALLRRLTVFAGIFRIEDAEAVCTDADVDASEVFDLLGSLVAKSLVRVGGSSAGGPSRGRRASGIGSTATHRLFETVRLYGADKLREAGESDLFRERHRDWLERWASNAPWEDVFWAPRPEDLDVAFYNRSDVGEIQADLRAALEWSEAEGRLDRVIALAARTFPIWMVLGNFEEAYGWLTKARPEDLDLSPDVRAAVLSAASLVAQTLSYPDTVELGERAVAAAGDVPSVPLVYALIRRSVNRAIWSLLTLDDDLAAAARADGARVRTVSETLSVRARTQALNNTASVEMILGDISAAYEACVAAASIDQNDRGALSDVAACAHILGDRERALDAGNRLLTLRRGPLHWVPSLSEVPPIVALGGAGELERAAQLLTKRFGAVRQYGNWFGVLEQFAVAGAALAFLGADHARCSRLLAWVRSRTFDAGQILFSATAFALYRHYTALLRQVVDKEDARRYRQEGRAMSEDEAMACALGEPVSVP